MAYDLALADRVRAHLEGEPVEERKMFGGLAFLVGGHMSVAVSGGQGGLLVRVDPAETGRLLAEPGAEEFSMGGRGPMAGWLRVGPGACEEEPTLGDWVERGLRYARTLPPK
jgi:TfoX/Sxy family transcriptional regulator of competence genes